MLVACNMSEYSYDDSFDSDSGSDGAPMQEEGGIPPILTSTPVGSLLSTAFTGSLPLPPPPSPKELHSMRGSSVKGYLDVEHSEDCR